MICSTKCIKCCFFVFNFLWVALVVFQLGAFVYTTVKYEFTYNTNEEILYLVMFIVLHVLKLPIVFLGCVGAIKNNRRLVIIYAVASAIIFIVDFAFAIKGFVDVLRYYNNEYTAYVDSYLSDFDNYWTEYVTRLHIDSMQSDKLCCGSTGPSHWDKFTSKKIPWSCCGSDESVTCTKSSAFTTGCVAALHVDFYHSLAPAIGISTGLLALQVICFAFALILANSIRNNHQRGAIYSEEMNRLN